MIDEKNTASVTVLGGGTVKYTIIPIYALALFSSSKTIIYIINACRESSLNSIYTNEDFLTWTTLLIGSLLFYSMFYKKAEKKLDFGLTIFVISITLVQICWTSTFLPFTKGTLEIGACVSCEIMKEVVLNDGSPKIQCNKKPLIIMREKIET